MRRPGDSPHGERTAAGHLRLLLDVAMRALLVLLLPVEVDRSDPLQGLVANHIPIRDRFHIANDIGSTEAGMPPWRWTCLAAGTLPASCRQQFLLISLLLAETSLQRGIRQGFGTLKIHFIYNITYIK